MNAPDVEGSSFEPGFRTGGGSVVQKRGILNSVSTQGWLTLPHAAAALGTRNGCMNNIT